MLKVFSTAQRDELVTHLVVKFPEESLDELLEKLDSLCEIATGAMGNFRQLERERAYFRAESAAIVHHGTELDRLVADWLMLNDDGTFVRFDDFVPGFRADLMRVITRAADESNKLEPRTTTTGRGRHADFLRDQLISGVFELYLARGVRAAKREDSHFEMTVRLLLRYIDQEIEDVHRLVRKALKRCPPSGVVITERN